MKLTELTAISPVDGRYRNKVSILAEYFSEYALMRFRVFVEIRYFIALCELNLRELQEVSPAVKQFLENVHKNFSIEDAGRIKEIERKINHDVKAVEYFLKEKLEPFHLEKATEFIHFGLTSQDINNTALPLMVKNYLEEVHIPRLKTLIEKIESLAQEWKDVPMLARTHGQPASPTRLGKEFQVYVARLEQQLSLLKAIPFSAKFGGATGNFNAHYAAYPAIDWHQFASRFLNSLGLQRSFPTTQIDHYDNFAALLDANKRINTILIDLCQDCWLYISMDYFRQKINPDEVGSSAMPHKVNPIDFENAEGNAGISNALLSFMSQKLPVSRLQRDLTDSTVTRNTGVAFAHAYLTIQSVLKGLDKLLINREKIDHDLEENWMVIAEAIQTILKREGYPKPYEMLKALTRQPHPPSRVDIQNFIRQLDIPRHLKDELLSITPFKYTGK